MTAPIDFLEERELERLREEQRSYKARERVYTDPDYLNELFESPEGKFLLSSIPMIPKR